MADVDYYRGNLVDFARYGKLDAYELTDEELARLLEVWRWSVWSQRSSPEDDVRVAAQQLQRGLAQAYNVEVEYNTALLLKQEVEPLIYLRALLDLPKVLGYFLRNGRAIFNAIRQHKRCQRVVPVRDTNGTPLGYPRREFDELHVRAPDVLHRRYWRQLSPYSFEERKRRDDWW
jgi:hypothetical protein